MKRYIYFTGGCAVFINPNRNVDPVRETVRLIEGHHVRWDDSKKRGIEAQYPVACRGGERLGATIVYSSPEQLAYELNAVMMDENSGELYADQIMMAAQ